MQPQLLQPSSAGWPPADPATAGFPCPSRVFRFRVLNAFIVLAALATIPVAIAAAEVRAARSVHLGYPAPEGRLFHTEMVVEESVNGSFFMACGWNTGYFGLQQLSGPDDTVVIFSVWDPTAGDDPRAVAPNDRVEVLYEGDGVRIRRFGGEGTGGQCMAPYSWSPGDTNRFLLHAEVQGDKTAYTAWIVRATGLNWRKLATFRTRTGGKPLSGYYSFVEDFRRDGSSANEVRRARYGNGWVQSVQGDWVALTRARFTASGADWEAKETINAGMKDGWFFLATGGDTVQSLPLRTVLQRTPAELSLPDLATPPSVRDP